MLDQIMSVLQKNNRVKQVESEENLLDEIKNLRKENEILKKKLSDVAIEKFKTRRSIRKFSNKKVDFKIIHNIIEAGLNAPCAGNIGNSKIIIVESLKKKQECAKAALQQYWMCDASCLLVIIREDTELYSLYPDMGKIYSIQNTAALIENILMAAHFYSLGACWVGAGDNDALKELLKIPESYSVDAIIPIGYSMEDPKVEKDPMVAKVFFDKYGNKEK